MKKRFVIVGSGWRSMYYVRVAKALPEVFELSAMLCRTQEKAQKIHEDMDIHTTISVEECENYNPDFVVVAVNKTSLYNVSKEWLDKGYTVLCETPLSDRLEDLQEIWKLRCERGYKLCMAEQYAGYPTYSAMLKLLASGIIGEPYNVTMSLAHDYHGSSLMKKILGITNQQFSICGKKYTFPVMETATRYDQYIDGRVADKSRDILTFEFENGKVGFYDFCSEQYRSSIRNNYVKVQGVRGELQSAHGKWDSMCGGLEDADCYYMDENNIPKRQMLMETTRKICIKSDNPNLREVTEVCSVTFGEKVLYEPEFGLCGLAEDETAIATVMLGAAEYNNGGKETYPLSDALQDSYMSILIQEALNNTGKTIVSQPQPWN